MKYTMRSISDFIQEQETGITVASNCDNLEKAYAECAAALSLATCYSEQAMIMEFAEENGIDSLNIIQEDGNEEKKENIFKRAGAGLKNAWGKVVEFFKAIYRKISGFVADQRMAKLKELIDELPNEGTIPSFDHQAFALSSFIKIFDEKVNSIAESLADGIDNVANASVIKSATDAMQKKLDEWNKNESTSGEVTCAKVKEKFADSFEKGKIQSAIKSIDKGISALEKAAKKNDKDENGDKTAATAQKATAEQLTGLINVTTQCYDVALKKFNKAYDTLKGGIKKFNKATKESFYYV